jgi:hypothetical protein
MDETLYFKLVNRQTAVCLRGSYQLYTVESSGLLYFEVRVADRADPFNRQKYKTARFFASDTIKELNAAVDNKRLKKELIFACEHLQKIKKQVIE